MQREQQLAWIRAALVAHGGWNRRSRAALHAWARMQGIDGAGLRALLERGSHAHAAACARFIPRAAVAASAGARSHGSGRP